MCIFTNEQALSAVSGTKIFARHSAPGRQQLVYSMKVSARDALAMILPIPTPPGSAEDAVRFIDLEAYPRFFDDMDTGFPVKKSAWAPGVQALSGPVAASVLQVHAVGLFEASFVPSQRDFVRLDPRFTIPTEVWAAMPQYDDYGFAVFQLESFARAPKEGWLRRLLGLFAQRPSGRGPEEQTIHPMAFEFPTRNPDQLFFPTVHVHDGQVHDTARFDHVVYCQRGEISAATPPRWETTMDPAAQFMRVEESQGLVQGDHPISRQTLRGDLPNRDTYLPDDVGAVAH